MISHHVGPPQSRTLGTAAVPHGICAICGTRPASTRDHVPPRGIFPKPRPRLVTVPACFPCNNDGSSHDEVFRVYLSLHVGVEHPSGNDLFHNHAVRTLRTNRRLLGEIDARSAPVWFTTPGGIVWGEGRRVLWNSRSHDAVVERTVRGLYFHHFDEVLGDRATVKVQWLRSFPQDVLKFMKNCPLHVIGNGQFEYRYVRAADQPLSSLWLMSFYGKHYASGYTFSKNGA
jgi:hypothetical protein